MPQLLLPHWQTTDNKTLKFYHGDVREVCNQLPSRSVHCVVTSPPYWGLRDYKTGSKFELGSEKTPEEYVEHMLEVFQSVRRVLRDDGTLWINLGDTYSNSGINRQGKSSKTLDGGEEKSLRLDVRKGNHGHTVKKAYGLKTGNLVGIPWRVALAMQAEGWILRQDIIWHKPSCMPDSVKNRCTKAHEYIFLFVKKGGYYYDNESIKEQSTESSGWAKQRAKGINTWKYNDTEDRIKSTGQTIESSTIGSIGKANKRSVWTIPPVGYPGAHYATFPPKLIEPCILAGTSEKGCCPDCGAPWERCLKASDEYEEILNKARNGHDWYARSTDNSHKRDKGKKSGNNQTISASYETIGWQPRCSCGNQRIIPCTVLDPFLGSGTTAEVSIKHKRRCVGIELSEKYLNRNAIPRACVSIQKYRPTMLELIPD